VAAEALANVRRHSGAIRAWLRVEVSEGTLTLEVSDDGDGLRAVPDGPDGRDGVGLTSMRERALELGGTFTAEDRPGGGTLVRVTLPAREGGDRDDPGPAR
ncbi:ATP-binding protein, partial [Streptosporangium algeriense]